MIVVDGRMKSLLDFKPARRKALETVARNEKIDWFLDLGLVDNLTYPLGDEREGKALHLAIDHFLNELYSEFEPYTNSLTLYQGSPFFKIKGDVYESAIAFSQYLEYLVINIPDRLKLKLDFRCESMTALERARLINRELYSHFHYTLNGQSLEAYSDKGILLPSVHADEYQFKGYELLMNELDDFRIIFEPYLTSEWDGLNELYVLSHSITPQARRKLLGFNAAGGTVVTVGESLNLPLEKMYDRSR
jgi:hypothetical protein